MADPGAGVSRTRRCGRSTSRATAHGTGSSRWHAPRWRGIVDPQTGAEITQAGVPGELRIKGPGVFPGYLRPGQTVTLAKIVAHLRDLGIATYKLPERPELRDELPRNPLGKILKRDLRDELRSSP